MDATLLVLSPMAFCGLKMIHCVGYNWALLTSGQWLQRRALLAFSLYGLGVCQKYQGTWWLLAKYHQVYGCLDNILGWPNIFVVSLFGICLAYDVLLMDSDTLRDARGYTEGKPGVYEDTKNHRERPHKLQRLNGGGRKIWVWGSLNQFCEIHLCYV